MPEPPNKVAHPQTSLFVLILNDAMTQYRGWIEATHTTDAERELVQLKYAECERRLRQILGV